MMTSDQDRKHLREAENTSIKKSNFSIDRRKLMRSRGLGGAWKTSDEDLAFFVVIYIVMNKKKEKRAPDQTLLKHGVTQTNINK